MSLFRSVVPLLVAACASTPLSRQSSDVLLVVAPHPDDEVLMAGGTVAQWVAKGRQVEVVVITNGDLGCQRNGWRRQRESIAALRQLGLAEAHVHFLGYPDGALDQLGPTPLPPRPRRDAHGRCVFATGSYGWAGEAHQEEHRRRTGQPAPYTDAALQEDLESVLKRFVPTVVVVPHDVDEHPDHVATTVWVRRALASSGMQPTLWRAMVHAGPVWPHTAQGPAFAPAQLLPPLPPPLDGYAPTLRWPIDVQVKTAALLAYQSQFDAPFPLDWLASFAKAEEAFFIEPPNAWRHENVGPLPQLEWHAGQAHLKVGRGVWRSWPAPQPLRAAVRQVGGYVEVGVFGKAGWVGEAIVPAMLWQPAQASAK
jgi:LmbE family N-acetylglucosaminyl deacetylase